VAVVEAVRVSGTASGLMDHSIVQLVVFIFFGIFSYTGTHLATWYLAGRPQGPERTILDFIIARVTQTRKAADKTREL